jgi:hypothetical protein
MRAWVCLRPFRDDAVDEAEPGLTTSALGLLALLAVSIGVVARVRTYLADRSLWHDELLLASNIVQRSWLALTKPLSDHQSAPVAFLWVERAAVRLAGPSELALRALPFACGIAVPLGLWLVGRRLLGPREALLAGIFAALSGLLIYYANEAKPYGVDSFLTVVLIGLTWDLLRHPDSGARWWRLGVGTTAILTLSQPAPFTLVGIAGALVLDRKVRSGPRWFKRIAIICGVWGLTLGALYLINYRAAASNPELLREWSGTFLDIGAADFRSRAVNAAHAALVSPIPGNLPRRPNPLLDLSFVLLFLTGAARATKVYGWSIGPLLGLPLLALALASALGQYPIADRFLLFAAPLVFLAYSSSLVLVADLFPASMRRPILAGLGGLSVVLGAPPAIRALADPVEGPAGPPREEARDLIREAKRLGRGDPIYVFWLAVAPWSFYTGDRSCERPYTAASMGVTPRGVLCAQKFDMHWDASRGWHETAPSTAWADGEVARMASAARPTIWMIASHFTPPMVASLLIAAQRAGAHVVYAHLEPGAALYKLRFPRP